MEAGVPLSPAGPRQALLVDRGTPPPRSPGQPVGAAIAVFTDVIYLHMRVKLA